MGIVESLEKELNNLSDRLDVLAEFNNTTKIYHNKGLNKIHAKYKKGSEEAKKRSSKSLKSRKLSEEEKKKREEDKKAKVKENRSTGSKKGWATRRNKKYREELQSNIDKILLEKIEKANSKKEKERLEEKKEDIKKLIDEIFNALGSKELDKENIDKKLFYNDKETLESIKNFIEDKVKDDKTIRKSLVGNIIDILDMSYKDKGVFINELEKRIATEDKKVIAALNSMLKDDNSYTFDFYGTQLEYSSNNNIFAIALYKRYRNEAFEEGISSSKEFLTLIQYCLAKEPWVFYGKTKLDANGKVKGKSANTSMTPREAYNNIISVYNSKFKYLYK